MGGFTHDGEFVLVAEDGANDLKNYPVKCVNGRIWVNNHAHVLQGKAGISDNSFLAFAISQSDIESLLVGGSRAKLNAETLMSIEFKLPCLQEQYRIGEYLTQLDHLITLHQRKCANLCSPSQVVFSLLFATSTFSWEQRKAIDIADYSKGNGYSKGDLTDAGTPIILYGRLYTKYQFAISEVDTFAFPRNGAVYSQGNEVIVPASGETAEDIARASAVEKSGVLLGGDLNILRPFDFINPLFLALAISNGEPQKELAKKAQGKSVVHIHNTDIQEVTIAYPSRTEQDRIVSVFRQLDNLITLHQRECISFTGRADRLILTANKKRTTSSWEQRKFEEIAVRSSVICSDDTLPRVEYEDIVSGTGRLNKDIYAKQSSKSGIVFHQGDVLYGKLRPYLQNWLLPTFDGLAVGDFWVLQPQNADSSFLYRLIQSRQFDEVANQSTGTKMPRADWKLVSKTVFSIPSNISEQAAIGTYFTALDSLITLHQRKCIFFTGRAGRLISTVNKKRITSSWEQRKLGDMMNVTSVKRIHQSDWTDSGVRFLRARDIVAAAKNEEPDDYLYISKEKYEEYSTLSGKVGVSDLLVTGVGTIGVPYLVRNLEPLYFKDGNIIWFQNSDKIDGKFLFYSFSAEQIQGFINESAGIGTVGTYTIESGKKTPISLPNQIEQAKVGEFFQQLDNLITLHQRKPFLMKWRTSDANRNQTNRLVLRILCKMDYGV